jgi:ABC-type oligopeptide transport system substrate-binding subunit/class 3 adenylate cyclase
MSSQLPFTDLPEGTVTFLFTDIEGSTELLKQLRDQYQSLLSDQRKILRAAFEKWGGYEVDTQGDAFFVAFPRATDAVKAVMEIQRGLAEHDWPAGVEVRVRMGLHTGEPWVSDEGYVGMDVHRAARIAHVGHGGQVLLSETTAPLLRDELPEGVILLDLGRHRLKDMKGPEHIQQLMIEDFPGEFPPLKSLEVLPPEVPVKLTSTGLPSFFEIDDKEPLVPVFVGRERSLKRLAGFFKDARSGKGAVAFITGSPGRGKTALMEAFAQRVMREHPDLLVLKGGCRAHTGIGDPYLPFREIMEMLMGDLEAPLAASRIQREAALRLWNAMPTALQALIEEGSDLLDVFVSGSKLLARARSTLAGGERWMERLASLCEVEQRFNVDLNQSNLFEQYEGVLGKIAQESPLLLVLDDLQWADSASVNLLFHLSRQLAGKRILILGAYRPEEVSLGRGENTHPLEKVLAELKRQYGDIWIDLGEESKAEGMQFIEAFLDSEPNRLSDAFRQAMYRHTDGHPLFTVELLRDMQEQGDLVQDAQGFWVEGPGLDWTGLPTRVEGVIEERVGRLEENLRETLTIASVEGQDFTAQVVGQVQEVSERKILTRLSRELEKHHRLVEAGQETQVGRHILSRYRFAHTLFQKYMYNDLSPGERRILHGEVAQVLEQLYAGRTEEIAVQLAHHYSMAKEADQAVQYLLMAGDQARTSYAYEEAIDFYMRALALQKESGFHGEAARSLMKLGSTYHSNLDFQRAREAYAEGFDLWRLAGEAPMEVSSPAAPHPLRVSIYNPPTLDPNRSYDTASMIIIDHLFSGLVELTPGLDIIPDVARSWNVQEDGRKYTFYLREDVAWSDGEQVTAGDFEFAWKRLLDPSFGSRNALLLYDIKGAKAYHQGQSLDSAEVGVRALDDVTLELALNEPTGYFMHLLAYNASYPIPKHIVEVYGDEWTEVGNIVTNGPFMLQAFKWNDRLTMVRNPHYHGQYQGNVECIEFCLADAMTSTMPRYESDQLDIQRLWGLSPIEFDSARHHRANEYMSRPEVGTGYMGFDVSQPPFDDIRVRRAFAMSIDKVGLNHVTMKGYVFPATGGFVPPGIPGHSEGIGLNYDPEKAQRLLAEAGYPEGRGFPVVKALTFVDGAPYAEFLSTTWKNILGMEIPWEILEFSEYLEKVNQGHSQIFGAAWQGDYPDPDSFLRTCIFLDLTSWQNHEYQNLIETARYAPDQGERMKLYQQADRMLMEEAVIVPLSYTRDHILVKPWVKKYPISSIKWLYGKDVLLEPH